jgi:hypothetical protein
MRPALKLSEIEQEHLQEVYDAGGVPRDQLPYSAAFAVLCKEFQGRTFKNAHEEQVYGALIKYVRASTVGASGEGPASEVPPEHLKALKGLLTRLGTKAKLLPYSDEFEQAKKEFKKIAGLELSDPEFWLACTRAGGPKRPPPPRKKAAAARDDDDE